MSCDGHILNGSDGLFGSEIAMSGDGFMMAVGVYQTNSSSTSPYVNIYSRDTSNNTWDLQTILESDESN